MLVSTQEILKARRKPECGHPENATMFWCNACQCVYNMGTLDCGKAEFDVLFKDWLVIGSQPKE